MCSAAATFTVGFTSASDGKSLVYRYTWPPLVIYTCPHSRIGTLGFGIDLLSMAEKDEAELLMMRLFRTY